jgi:probable HAF family extracellular repeat protein
MINLGTLGGPGPPESESRALAVNNPGQVVGVSGVPFLECAQEAFSWTQAGGMIGIGGTTPSAINDHGQVVGELVCFPGPSHAFSWTQADGLGVLDTLGGDYSTASGVNNLGQVVGQSATASGATHGVMWQPGPTSPTSKEQCKNGGWRNFPQFRNQGDCVSFVAHRGSAP